jgi:HSP20 family protein
LRTQQPAVASSRRSTCSKKGEDLLAIIELPGVDKNDLQLQAKENTIRISGKKAVVFPEAVSVHRRERFVGAFDRTLSLPVQLDPNRIKAEYRDGILALYLPRCEATNRGPSRSTKRT